MPDVVCNGATCSCALGSAPAKLIVTSQQGYRINNMAVATITDCAPVTNLPPFGTCQTLTAAASGTPTPCALAPVGVWAPGSALQKINNIPVLTGTSKLTCGVGGLVSISDANNKVESTK